MKALYILLRDQIANRRERGLLARQKSDNILVLAGSLWETVADIPAHAEVDGSAPLNLTSLEFEGVVLQCKGKDARLISEKEFQLLVAMNSCAERLRIVNTPEWLREGIEIDVDSFVYIIKFHDLPEMVPGRVKYKGALPSHNGIWFGVEFSAEYHGKGTSDGTFRKKSFFRSPPDSAIFIAINRIRKCDDANRFVDYRSSDYSVPHRPTRRYEDDMNKPPLNLGERIVWMSDQGPEHGLVRWIGYLKDSRDKEWTVGVEFDRPVGTGTGKYKDEQLFRAKQNHASLIPILGLMKEETFYESTPGAAGGKHGKMVPTNDALHVHLPENISPASSTLFKPSRGLPDSNSSSSSTPSPTQRLLGRNTPSEVHTVKEEASYGGTGSQAALHLVAAESGRNQEELMREQEYLLEQAKRKRGPVEHSDPSAASGEDRSIYDNAAPEEDFPSSPPEGMILDLPSDNERGAMDRAMEVEEQLPPYHESCHAPASGRDYEYVDEKSYIPMTIEQTDGPDHFPPPPTGISASRHGAVLGHSRSHSGASQSDAGSTHTAGSNHTIGSTHSAASNAGGSLKGAAPPPPLSAAGASTVSPSPTEMTRHKLEVVEETEYEPIALDPVTLKTDIDVGHMVEVVGYPPELRYGVVRWIGYYKDINKPIVGLEMEEESKSCSDGTFQGKKLFDCPSRKAFFVYLKNVRRDPRFNESTRFVERSDSQAFGSLECPDVGGTIPPAVDLSDVKSLVGKQKGIQGHHNSCYLDATLFSMFSFTVVFDSLLYRPKTEGDMDGYEEVQLVLRESIVNPLRKNFYVRADKVMKLRQLLDKMGSVKGLVSEEKDPEEFLNSLLQQIMRVDPFLKLSNGQESYFYQLFLEKSDHLMLPTTQQLLSLSFLQSDLKLAEAPACLIVQMPRFGKNYKMYQRIVPSLEIDITDILEHGPRECCICGQLATHECKECFNNYEEGLEQIAFCQNCLEKSHSHTKRATHRPQELKVHQGYLDFINSEPNKKGRRVPREMMELFAVVCIQTSHYVAFVRCGSGPEAPWLFFDSMADRMGEQHGYNVPEVRECSDIKTWLSDNGKNEILTLKEDKMLPELMRRLLCDSYMCFYQNPETMMYK